MVNRIDGIGGSGPTEFNIGDHKVGLLRDCQFDHMVSIFCLSNTDGRLVRGQGRRNKIDPVQRERFFDLQNGSKMSEMNRIKCSPKESDSHAT